MKNRENRSRYGRCHTCGATMRARRIKQTFWIKGKLLVVEGVPAGVCPQCGERVVNGDVGRRLATLIQDTAGVRRARTVKVPIIRFAKNVT